MRTAQLLAIGFIAAAEVEPSSLGELARAAGFDVVDGIVFSVQESTIVIPRTAGETARDAMLLAALASTVYRWAGSPEVTSPARIAVALRQQLEIKRAERAPSQLRLRAVSASDA